jgi:hypothetical protein
MQEGEGHMLGFSGGVKCYGYGNQPEGENPGAQRRHKL